MRIAVKFSYKTLQDLRDDAKALQLTLPIQEDTAPLAAPLTVNRGRVENRLGIHPMEGCDGESDGSPGPLTHRRYQRFAAGGAGLLWFEAVAVHPQGMSNKRQLRITPENVDAFKVLVEAMHDTARQAWGGQPYNVFQLTHSGRYGMQRNIAVHIPELDAKVGLEPDYPVISDDELAGLVDHYVQAAKLAKAAGFDAVDIKGCHRYLLSELLGAHTRPGRYGGSYENRTRMFRDIAEAITAAVDVDLAIRFNSYDALPLPYGWGCDEHGEADLSEPKRFVHDMEQLGVGLFNVSASSPYTAPHISRPYDQPGRFGYPPPEPQLKGVDRLLNLGRELKQELPNSVVMGTGYSWLRHMAGEVAAATVAQGWIDIVGFGRGAFAYPDFANDILRGPGMQRSKACITCTKCAELKASKALSGCVVRDSEVYLEPYRQLDQKA